MNSPNSSENDFLTKLTEIVEANLTNPQFGVSLLAKEMGMSRSNLHRKVNEISKITVSQFINQVRLKKAKEILQHSSETVSDVAYKVGFNNVSYFIKCFHKYYGYSPGEVGNRQEETEELSHFGEKRIRLRTILISTISTVIIVVVFIFIFKPFQFQQKGLKKTIAILPAQNFETFDSIAIDGILQNTRDNLCRIKDIEKVVPWISVLQYKNTLKPAPEIAKELGINYLVKPRVWMSDNKIYLSVTLIEGLRDKTLSIPVYEIDSNNITTIHQDILRDIAEEIDISITPAEKVNIDKLITANKKARNYYWEGIDIINLWRYGEKADLNEAVTCFENAIKYDNEFALAYAQLARTYHNIDYHLAEKIHLSLIEEYADKALLYDSELDMSWIAKALFYYLKQEYEFAVQLLEKAIRYNPKSELAIYRLTVIYAHFYPNTERSLEYALLAKKLNITFSNSVEQSFLCRRLCQAFRYSGFLTEAEEYINESLELNPENVGALVEKANLLTEMTGKYEEAREILVELFKKDSSNLWVIRHLALTCYLKRDFEDAYKYYKKFAEMLETKQLVRNPGDYCRIGFVFHKMGMEQESEEYFIKFENLNSSNNYLKYAKYYSFRNDTVKAFECLKLFSEQNNYPIYNIRNLKQEPLFDNIRELPEFQKLLTEIEVKFWKNHEQIRKNLEKKGLL